jgi:hypothetical protein
LQKQVVLNHPAIESERITWEQVVDCAQKINDEGSGTWGMIFDQISRYYQLQALPESLGGGSGVCEGGLSVKGCLTNDGMDESSSMVLRYSQYLECFS